jgi:hypothetical protein
MRTLSKILVAVAVGALASPALAGAATKPGTRGIIVQRDARAGVVVVATPSGSLVRVKFAKPMRLAMGSVVKVHGAKVAVVGHSHRAKLRGVVVRRHHKSFALAGNGSVVAVTSPTPPAAGEQVTATVQVTPTALDDDNGDEQVDNGQVGSVEVRGTFASATATTLTLMVPGFPTGLAIGITGQTLPAIAAGTPVEARVSLAPDPSSTLGGVLLTLVSLHVEGNNQGGGNEHGGFVKAEGMVTNVIEAGTTVGSDPGSITIQGEHGMVTFVIPAGFGPTGVVKGNFVEAKGTPAATLDGQPTLVRLELKNDDDENNNNTTTVPGNGGDEGDSGGGHDGSGNGGND